MSVEAERQRTIVLGPMIEVHSGIHGSLIDSPPPDVRYRSSTGSIHYWHRAMRRWSPLEHMAVDEVAVLQPTGPCPGRYAVHTSRVPAHGSVPWLADADCLLATLMFGRDFMFGRGADAPALAPVGDQSMRVGHVLRRYLRADCFGVLFNTAHFRDALLDFAADSGSFTDDEMDRLGEKASVVIPAAAVPDGPTGTRPGPFRVCYAARVGSHKGQEVAEATFRSLKRSLGDRVDLVWLGLDPPTSMAGCARVLPTLDRPDYLELISTCDVYFAPSTSESLGMAMIEAAALGAVVVTGAGSGVPHLAELFADDVDAVVIDPGSRDERTRGYVAAIGRLAADPSVAPRLRERAVEVARRRLSDRNTRLVDAYDAMFDAYDRVVEASIPLPADGPSTNGLHKSSVDLSILRAMHRRLSDQQDRNLTFVDEGLRPVE